MNGKNLITGATTPCTDNCHTTTNTNILECKNSDATTRTTTTCAEGFGLTGATTAATSMCEACTVTNCKDCAAAKAGCSACKDGFFATGTAPSITACTACEANTATCTSLVAATACNAGFCLGHATEAHCYTCPTNCSHKFGSAYSAQFTVAA